MLAQSRISFAIIFCALLGFGVAYYFLKSNSKGLQAPARITGEYKADSFELRIVPARPLASYELIMDKGSLSRQARQVLFHKNPNFLVWNMLILIMVTIAAGAFPYFVTQIFWLRRRYAMRDSQIWLCILFSVLLLVVIGYLPSQQEGLYKLNELIAATGALFKGGYVVSSLVQVTMALVVPAVVLMVMVIPATDRVNAMPASMEESAKAAASLQALAGVLSHALQLIATVVVFSVLTSIMLGASLEQEIVARGFSIFPKPISYVYGLTFSLFLAILYVPAHIYLQYKSAQFRSWLQFETRFDDKWKDQLMGGLNLNASPIDNLKMAFTVLSPLLSSFLPELAFGK